MPFCDNRNALNHRQSRLGKNIEHAIPPLVLRRGHDPVGVGRDHDVEDVQDLHDVLKFALDRQGRLGDEAFQNTVMLFVAREESFVSEQRHAVA